MLNALFKITDEKNVVQGEGFEPPKAEPDDLQSPVFDRFTIPACFRLSPKHVTDIIFHGTWMEQPMTVAHY